jgi:F0F1-type ATP synthase assembly protein I
LKTNPKKLNNYARFSGIAFQMIIIILGGTFGGLKLDEVVKLRFPLFTVVLSLLSVFAALYIVLKEFIGKK